MVKQYHTSHSIVLTFNSENRGINITYYSWSVKVYFIALISHVPSWIFNTSTNIHYFMCLFWVKLHFMHNRYCHGNATMFSLETLS